MDIAMVSVIIPTLNEERRLPGCLATLFPQARRHGAEVLVADGGSDDATVTLAQGHGSIRVLAGARGRGRQMNAGAREARGSLLLFLPADSRLPPGALGRLAVLDDAEKVVAGGFRQRFDARRPLLRAISRLHNWRAALTGVIYGDQALFVSKALFLEMGGFREDMDLEDVEFGVRLRQRVKPRLLELVVTTSSRRFDQAGDVRATVKAALILASWSFLRRVPHSRTFFTPVR